MVRAEVARLEAFGVQLLFDVGDATGVGPKRLANSPGPIYFRKSLLPGVETSVAYVERPARSRGSNATITLNGVEAAGLPTSFALAGSETCPSRCGWEEPVVVVGPGD